MTAHLKQYVDHIRNTGQVPLLVSMFDDDWEPIGPRVRKDLLAAGMIVKVETTEGKEAILVVKL